MNTAVNIDQTIVKNIKDYLHLYLGAECIIGDLNWKPDDISDQDRTPYTDKSYGAPIKSKISLHVLQVYSHKTTPILRPLTDMTEEEAAEVRRFKVINTIIPCPHFNNIHKLEHG